MIIYIWSLLILSIVLVGQIFAINGLNVSMPLINILLHVFGGLGIGLFIFALINSKVLKFKSKHLAIVVIVIIVGVIWELIEVYYNVSGDIPGTKLYYINTSKDIINDIIGGLLAVWFLRNKI